MHCKPHHIQYALLLHQEHINIEASLCKNCSSVFQFYRDVKDILLGTDATNELKMEVISNSLDKAKLFLGHKICVCNQQIAIAKILYNLCCHCLSNKGTQKALEVLDFKMK